MKLLMNNNILYNNIKYQIIIDWMSVSSKMLNKWAQVYKIFKAPMKKKQLADRR